MAPRPQAESSAHNSPDTPTTNPSNTTKVYSNGQGISYVRCDSSEAFISSTKTTPAEQVNSELNLNLGLPVDPDNTTLRRIIRFLNDLLLSWWENYLFYFWGKIVSFRFRKFVTFLSWKIYFQLHKFFLGNRTGIHPDASLEYHALTTIMWWGRLFPVTVDRMRFSLSQLSVIIREDCAQDVETVEYDMKDSINQLLPSAQQKHTTVRGLYVRTSPDSIQEKDEDKKVVFWLYGGAFLGGCCAGNLGPASSVGHQVGGRDVFLPQYRLLPEYEFHDMLWDVALAYRYLVTVRNIKPSNILLFGISSGAGLCTRLLQFVSEVQQEKPTLPTYVGPLLKPTWMPSGAVLMCPFVDYTEPQGTLAEYPKHDLIVNQSVTECGFPYFELKLGNDENRRAASPVYRTFKNLPPLCVVVSEHEVVYEQTVELVNHARKEGVQVSLGVWKYMCHVFSFFSAFIPEGEQSMEFVIGWMNEHWKDKQE